MTASHDEQRELQASFKQRYRAEPQTAVVALAAEAHATDSVMACAVDFGRARYTAQAHAGLGGQGAAPCSGDLLLGALAACAQITCQMAAQSAGVSLGSVTVRVEGDLDLRGTLELNPRVPVGFAKLRIHFTIDAPDASPHQVAALQRATEQSCVVLQTLLVPPQIEAYWEQEGGSSA